MDEEQGRPTRPPIGPFIALVGLIALGALAIFAYASVKPLVAMTGQVVPRSGAAVAGRVAAAPVAAGQAPAGQAAAGQQPAGAAAVPPDGMGGLPPAPPPSAGEPAATAAPPATVGPLPKLERKQRVNILLLGSDTDLKFAPGQYLTQSMIVVSIDPATHTVGMLSIPRDLWVRIPGYGYGKIQVAYEVGGVASARATIEQNFGIPIHYYAWVGLQGFQKLIDTVGGVQMDVTHPVLDDTYPDDLDSADPYAYMRLFLPAGPQHLDGTQALQFVRSRHGDLIGDFGRSTRQQQLLLALKARLTGPTVITHLPQITAALQDSVRTDIPLTDLLPYASFARDLKRDEIHQVVLQPPTYSANGSTPDGSQQIVIPNWAAIDGAVAQMFGVQPRPETTARGASGALRLPSPTPNRPAGQVADVADSPPERPAAPTAPPRATAGPVLVLVENGTVVPGLGQRATQYLEGNGYRLLAPVNGRPGVARTTVTFYQPEAREAAYGVARLLGAVVIAGNRPPGSGPGVVVVLGSDAARRL